MNIHVGNNHAIEGYYDTTSETPDLVLYRPLEGERVITLGVPDEMGLQEAYTSVVHSLREHIANGERPAWIECGSPGLANLLREHYGLNADAMRRPQVWGAIQATALTMLGLHLWALVLFLAMSLHLRTIAGRDWQCRIMGDNSSTGTGAYASASWLGVSADVTVPLSTDTTLAGEVVGGTLTRARGVYAHTNGQASYTVSKTITSDQSIVIAKAALFTDVVGGTMPFAAMLNANAPLENGDATQITQTVAL